MYVFAPFHHDGCQLKYECSKELWEYKAEDYLENQKKTYAHRDPMLTLVPKFKALTLYSGSGTVP